MKFIKCLSKHCVSDYIGIVLDATEEPQFYVAKDIIKTNPNLLNYRVTSITTTNVTVNGEQVPAVLYCLGI